MSKYRKNESGDIMDDLNSLKVERQKEAVKKVISAMTTGRDVSKLFPQVVKCILTQDLELKKLVYLYIINYARIKPVETLLAVNAFKKDASDLNSNPLTRALAVRTMGCLGVDQIMQFLCDPLKDALNDKDPYVRKTGALCVAKIYDINAQLVEEQFGFIDKIQNMLEEESNAMVIANCISALIEISTTKGKDIININWKKCRHLMSALHENNEWTQIYLLEGISRYSPKKQDEINEIIERVLPCVSHSNSGVVLSSIKILIKLLDLVENPETIRGVCKKITPSLVTLLSSEPEIQYVALKNINILIQKRPIIFEKDIKMFFCTFTEPLYNKIEKLGILYKLVTMNNIDMVLNELREYASDVDVQFVRRSVRLIGQCAIKLEKAAQRCVETLVELVKTQVSFVIQEAIIGLRDIFRRYPNSYEGAMAIVNENLRTLDDPEAKAALIWIIGEYSDRIDGAEAQLVKFIDNMKEEPFIVQLQILNAATKTFLKCQTDESFNILNGIFDYCTKDCEIPDIRERGYMYYRLMSIDPQLASKIITTEKPRISEDISGYDNVLLDKLLNNLGTLASVYSKPPELFVKKTKNKYFDEEEEGEHEESAFNLEQENNPSTSQSSNVQEYENEIQQQEIETKPIPQTNPNQDIANQNSNAINLLDIDSILSSPQGNQPPTNTYTNQPISPIPQQQQPTSSNDLLDIFGGAPQNQPQQISDNQMQNIMSGINTMNLEQLKSMIVPKMIVLPETAQGSAGPGKGLEIEAAFCRQNKGLLLKLSLNNKSSGIAINNFVLQFNKNFFGISIDPNCLSDIVLQPGQIIERVIPIEIIQADTTKIPQGNPPCTLQTGLRCNLNEYYFVIPIMFCVLFDIQINLMPLEQYQALFTKIQTTQDSGMVIDNINPKYQNLNGLVDRLKNNGVYMVNKNENPNGDNQLFMYTQLINGQIVFIGIMFNQSNPGVCNVMCKSESYFLIGYTLHALKFMLASDY